MGIDELKQRYWSAVEKTRMTGRISPSVIEKTEKKWAAYDEDVIRAALEIHLQKYQGMKENYTLGIMRNLQRQKEQGIPLRKGNQFCQFEQRGGTDYKKLEDELEAELLDGLAREEDGRG